MSEPTMETLARRLDRVEREVQWWRISGLAGVALLAALLLGATSPKVLNEVRAKSFVLVDENGTVHAQLFLQDNNRPVLDLYAKRPSGKSRATLHASGLLFIEENGTYEIRGSLGGTS